MGNLINCGGSKRDRAEWWQTLKMLKQNIEYDRETDNFLSMKKERDLFRHVINNVLFHPGEAPIRGQRAA